MNPVNKFTPRRIHREKTTLSSCSDSEVEPIHVYCRLRPLKDETESCIKLLSPTVLAMTTPENRNMRKEIHYKFKHIFTAYSSQKEIFDHVAYPLLEDLLKGKNSLLFTYGVTGSGKTHTLTGDHNDPGIMPRCIDTIFNSIGELQAAKYVIKSDRMNGFEVQSESDAINDRLSEIRNAQKQTKTPKKRVKAYANEGVRVTSITSNLYAVFVSYIEIYNNTVYDLLDESSGKTLQNKLLREDNFKNMYVNNVVEVEVKNSDEAFAVFNAGQRRKRMGATALNADSSRSHSIFNIRVVQLVQSEKQVPELNQLIIGQLSLVDLAGSERTSRTQNTGMRLREASSINNSLMSLRTCIEILRENQLSRSNKLVPYRDNRLTLLFKNYFEGDGTVQMIVCVNPSSDDFEENLHVMKFAEMSQDVKIALAEKSTPLKRNIEKTPIATPKNYVSSGAILPEIPLFNFNFDNVEIIGKSLDKLIKILKIRKNKSKAVTKDLDKSAKDFRKRLVEMYQENIVNKNELKSMKTIVNKARQKSQNLETKIADLETSAENMLSKNDELERVIRSLQEKLNEKDLRINQNIIDRQKVKQKFQQQTEKMSQELDAKLRRQREHVNAAMKAKDQKLKKVREILDSEIVVAMSENEENVAPSSGTTAQSSAIAAPSVVSPRTRRSRSVGEVWLEHNSIKPVPLSTVLQPSMKKRKSVTKLSKATDITNPKQSKYCLLAQEQDQDGGMETKLYKADIVATCSGGAQVVFNDVEKLTQQDPTQ